MTDRELAREWLEGLQAMTERMGVDHLFRVEDISEDDLAALLARVREESEWMEREKCICRLLCFDCVMQDETDWCEMCQSNAAAIRGEDDETIRLASLFGGER